MSQEQHQQLVYQQQQRQQLLHQQQQQQQLLQQQFLAISDLGDHGQVPDFRNGVSFASPQTDNGNQLESFDNWFNPLALSR